eukprot:5977252-Karenia_brevis.AAC.1
MKGDTLDALLQRFSTTLESPDADAPSTLLDELDVPSTILNTPLMLSTSLELPFNDSPRSRRPSTTLDDPSTSLK